MAKEIFEKIKNNEEKNKYLEIIGENKYYKELIEIGLKKEVKQNWEMFISKYKMILLDFGIELKDNFIDRGRVNVYNLDIVLTKINIFLNFLALIELLESMFSLEYLNTKWENLEILMNLFSIFDECSKIPDECFCMELNEKYEEETKELVKKKINEFLFNYIYGILKIRVGHLIKIKTN
uniref:Uncharacterized protein n=1 Tax=Meloidogyne floridensis TaxID=298350 RepID=A0A915NRK7_9BILA